MFGKMYSLIRNGYKAEQHNENHLTYRSEEIIVGVQGTEEETQQEPRQCHPERNRPCQCDTSNNALHIIAHLPDHIGKIYYLSFEVSFHTNIYYNQPLGQGQCIT